MGKFAKISQEAFQEMQFEAGLLLKAFDIKTGEFADADIITATSGGINASCVPTYTDFGSDVDNCPDNMMELKRLDSWLCKLAATALSTSVEFIRKTLGAADVDTTDPTKVTPRNSLKLTDFEDIWWVGDKFGGGLVAIRLMNALSTSGLTLQTTKKGKGQISVEFTGHYSAKNQDVVPMEFYSTNAEEGTSE